MIRSQISKDYFQVLHFRIIICWFCQSTICEQIYNSDGDDDDDDENDNKKVLMMIVMMVIVMLTLIILLLIIVKTVKLPALISDTVILKLQRHCRQCGQLLRL